MEKRKEKDILKKEGMTGAFVREGAAGDKLALAMACLSRWSGSSTEESSQYFSLQTLLY